MKSTLTFDERCSSRVIVSYYRSVRCDTKYVVVSLDESCTMKTSNRESVIMSKATKCVYAWFEFCHIKLMLETDREEAIYSSQEEDLIFFVFDDVNTTEETFLKKQEAFYEHFKMHLVMLSSEYSHQKRYHVDEESYNIKYEQVKQRLIDTFYQREQEFRQFVI